MTKHAPIEYGVDCRICGCKRSNVVHDRPEWRTDPGNPHSWPMKEQDGLNYYTWANVEFHEFQPGVSHVHRWRCECGQEMDV